ncbi:hypothetical protein DRO91_08775 [Candidatus Heimdallarchaeota archaeon]|nr:MAG: hypothetical protein DRO91_08775 [Candidatus Heimdallarchaeota archaeon]
MSSYRTYTVTTTDATLHTFVGEPRDSDDKEWMFFNTRKGGYIQFKYDDITRIEASAFVKYEDEEDN